MIPRAISQIPRNQVSVTAVLIGWKIAKNPATRPTRPITPSATRMRPGLGFTKAWTRDEMPSTSAQIPNRVMKVSAVEMGQTMARMPSTTPRTPRSMIICQVGASEACIGSP